MAYSESLAARIRQVFARRRGVTEKKMFGGVGFLLNGNMCVGVWKTSLIARLGPEQGESALNEQYVNDFDITGRPMKGWVMVEAEGVESTEELNSWIQRAVGICQHVTEEMIGLTLATFAASLADGVAVRTRLALPEFRLVLHHTPGRQDVAAAGRLR